MTRWRVVRAVGAVACALTCAGVVAACEGDLARMREQRRADPYAATSAFANGAVLQVPPPGTVPHTAVDTASPAVTPALLTEGRERYAIYCAVCHGAAGYGGSVVAANMVARRPPPLRSGLAATLAPAQLYAVTTLGFGRMPSYATQLTPQERWAVAAYVVALRSAPATGAAAADDSLRALSIAQTDTTRAATARAAGHQVPGRSRTP